MAIQKLSALADDFPMVEVEFEDLFGCTYKVDGRLPDGFLDCLGIVLEIYRRAGLLLPDVRREGRAFDFPELFEAVAIPDRLYDLVVTNRGEIGVGVVVRPGQVLSCERIRGVTLRPTKVFPSDTKFWRVRDDCLP